MGPKAQRFLELVRYWHLADRHAHIRRLCELAEYGLLTEEVAEAQLYAIRPRIEEQMRRPNFLHRAPEFEELYPHGPPDIVIGKLEENEEVPVGLSLKGPCHCIFAGQTGYGKTTAIRVLILKVVEYNRLHPDRPVYLVIIENKAGDFSDIRELIGDRCVHYDLHEQALMGLNPPRTVSPSIFVNDLFLCFCSRTGLRFSSVTLIEEFMFLLSEMNRGRAGDLICPDFNNLLDLSMLAPPGTFSSKTEYDLSQQQILHGLRQASGRLYCCSNGLDLERDVFQKGKWAVVLSMVQISPPWLRSFVQDSLKLQLLHGRMARGYRPGRTDCLFIGDENDPYVSKKAEEAFPSDMGICSRMFRMGRQFGLGDVLGLGQMGLAAPHVLGSAAYYFIFHLQHSTDVAQAAATLALTRGAESILTSLDRGEYVARLPGTWSHAVLCQGEYVESSAVVAPEPDPSPASPSRSFEEFPDMMQTLGKRVAEQEKNRLRQRKMKKFRRSKTAGQILRVLADHPNRTVAELSRLITPPPSREALEKALSELEEEELVEIEPVRVSRTTQRFIELTAKGYEAVGASPPKKHGRGGVAHRCVSHRVAEWASRHGYRSCLEWLVPGTSHHADAMWSIDSQNWAAEVAIDCLDNLVHHVRCCLVSSDKVHRMVIVAPQKQTLSELRGRIESEESLSGCLDRLLYETIDTYMGDR
ncbi:MAG: hypothetical protein JW955_24725 [Sedimentisphaerales bacterium]|nr:hypothetical protein [Sedimentisphaerales bacterium]